MNQLVRNILEQKYNLAYEQISDRFTEIAQRKLSEIKKMYAAETLSNLGEMAKSKAQQRFMGMVHAVQKGKIKAPSKKVAKAASSMSRSDAEDFAATKHKGLPEKVEEANKISINSLDDFKKHAEKNNWNVKPIHSGTGTLTAYHMIDKKNSVKGILYSNQKGYAHLKEAFHPTGLVKDGVLGQFREKDGKKHFDYSTHDNDWAKKHHLPHAIHVDDKKVRYGHVKGTVAHVAVDENPDGSPKMEKWAISHHNRYTQEEIEFEEGFDINEAARIRIVRARIRKGVVQRRKKVSNVKGYTIRKRGKGPPRLVRMSPIERRRRRLGQRRGKIKRRAKLSRIRQRMKRSLRKRHSIGLK